MADGNLDLKNVDMESLGGRIVANADQDLDATPDSQIRATLRNISLTAIQRALRTGPIGGAVLTGTLDGSAEVSWKGSISNLRARSDLTVEATASGKSNAAENRVPVNGAIHANYLGTHQTVELRDTILRIPSATLTAQGMISDQSSHRSSNRE